LIPQNILLAGATRHINDAGELGAAYGTYGAAEQLPNGLMRGRSILRAVSYAVDLSNP